MNFPRPKMLLDNINQNKKVSILCLDERDRYIGRKFAGIFQLYTQKSISKTKMVKSFEEGQKKLQWGNMNYATLHLNKNQHQIESYNTKNFYVVIQGRNGWRTFCLEV